jgi:hypothetical protein
MKVVGCISVLHVPDAGHAMSYRQGQFWVFSCRVWNGMVLSVSELERVGALR